MVDPDIFSVPILLNSLSPARVDSSGRRSGQNGEGEDTFQSSPPFPSAPLSEWSSQVWNDRASASTASTSSSPPSSKKGYDIFARYALILIRTNSENREDIARRVYKFIQSEGGSALFSKIGLNIKVDGKMSAFIQSFPHLFEVVGTKMPAVPEMLMRQEAVLRSRQSSVRQVLLHILITPRMPA